MAAVEQRIPSLDGLRALSIGLVLVGHAQFTIPVWQGSFLWNVVGNADLGVSIFFVISGFLITSLLLREEEKSGRISLTDFYIRRFFRIVPPFYAYLIAVVCLSALGWIKLEWPGTISAAAFVSDYYRTGTWWLGQTWSLGVEEQFYLMWPALLKLLGRNRALKVSSAIICIAPAIRVLSYALFPAQRGYMVRMFHNRLDALMFGCTLALVYDHPAFVRFGRRWLKPAVAAGVCIFLFLASPALRSRFEGAYALPFGYSLEAACITFFLLYAVKNHRGYTGRLFNTAVLKHVGVISYSLYLWQELFLSPERSFALPLSVNLVLAFAMAEISYRTVERVSLQLRRKTEAWRQTRSVVLAPEEGAA